MRAKPLGWDVPHQPPVGPLAGTWHCFLRAQGFAFNPKYPEQQHFYKPQTAKVGLTPKKEVEIEIQEYKRALRRGQLERKRNRGEKMNLLAQKPQRVESICEQKGQKEGTHPDRAAVSPGGEGQHHPHTALAGCWDGGDS